MIYPKPYTIYLRGTMGLGMLALDLGLGFRDWGPGLGMRD